MTGKTLSLLCLGLLLSLSATGAGAAAARPDGGRSAYEVWAIDQSDTRPDGGGTLYIYQGEALSGRDAASAAPEMIDLGGQARDLCLAQTGTAPRRPHSLAFNAADSHAVVAFVATGHVLFMNAEMRAPVKCIDVGAQAHAAVPSPDQTYVLVANQNGRLLQRISTDYVAGAFTLDGEAALDLATCTTPNGVPCQDATLRPDNAPIYSAIESGSRLAFVTLRGGGMFVVDGAATPMRIVAEYDKSTIHPHGLLGVEAAGKMYVNSGGGSPANPFESDLYAFPLSAFSTSPDPPNAPAPALAFSHDERGSVDQHGLVVTKHERFVWAADRAANRITVVDTASDAVAGEFSLVGPQSDDPAPDLMGISPSGNRVFISLRGPNPLTGNVAGINNAAGSTPGVGVVRVEQGGRRGVLHAIAPISRVVNGVERADPHAIAVRRRL